MTKKQTTKKRTEVKDLPRKDKKLSAGDMKKVKGGIAGQFDDPYQLDVKAPAPLNIAGQEKASGIKQK